ncbi:ABC transporter ATP-binding protein [Haloarcula nitratireducens]|uniref:Molybdate/tungstate import ATP-binding protein WtpC n=1 Tax=Haloarcula nitratireducens TaxID=2487749 RepID=A0AAW4PFM8_9EURY|nr:ABC transporter ATP-binding protein [Halomicroarcula nitratireducens]MBX0297216.1 ABC transporter ATP-binding protein [Halomicroarcula nitratireducens]
MAQIELDGISKHYGDLEAVSGVSTTVEDGELLCLLGPSGCGKSTTLRMIGGLEMPTEGTVRLNGEDITNVPPYDRDTSIVFQNWELFPHKSVLENVAFGLKMSDIGTEERHERAEELLERVEMSGYGSHDPTDLSGGQKQRVALARSLAVDPSVLLLDEPLSNLDKRLREQMEIHLKEIHEEFDKTFIYVTHNQDEAFTLADRIGIMNNGQLVQVGDPMAVYQNPTNRFTEEFLGDTNFVEGQVSDSGGELRVKTGFGVSIPLSGETAVAPGDTIHLSLRPEFLTLSPSDDQQATPVAATDGGHTVRGTLEDILYQGSTIRYSVSVSGTSLFVERHVGDRLEFSTGDSVQLQWDTDDVLLFRADGKKLEG